MNNMERFTQRAQRVLSLAQEEADRLRHNYIGTEHLLLGLLRDEGGIAGRVLRDLGLETRRVEDLVEELTRATARTTNTTAELSPGTKRVLELCVDEARRMGHHYIGTEHMLLGLVRQSEGVAIDVLKRLGVSPEEVRRQTHRVLQESPVQNPPSTPSQPVTSSPVTESTITDEGGRVLTLAREFADQLQHDSIRPEHLLVGLLREENGIAGRVLRRVLRDVGLEYSRVDGLVKELSQAGEHVSGTPRELSPQTKRLLELAVDEARRMGHPHISTEHLLLGIVRQSEGVAIDVLKRLGISPDEVRRQTRREIAKSYVKNPERRAEIPPAPPPPDTPDSAYTLMQSTIVKLLGMVENKSLTINQASELFSALAPQLKLSIIEQTELISQLFQLKRLQKYKVHFTVTDLSGKETPGETTLLLTRLLKEIDDFLALVVNTPDVPLIYTQDEFRLEVRIEKNEGQE